MHSRHPISWSDLAGAPVGLWGLGVEGQANLRKLSSLGVAPVLVDDGVPDESLADRVLRTDEGGLEALAACRYVVKSPGISRYRDEVAWLEEQDVPVLGGLGLWLQEVDRERVVAVTGTKGKSTTVSILGHLLANLGQRCFVGGNLGLPPYDPQVDQDVDWWVIEVSSYQATDLASSPPVVAVTSLHADHLNWHGDATRYFRDKLSLCTQPGAQLTIANGHDEQLRGHRHLLGPEVRWVTADADAPPAWVSELGVLGRHNHVNALVAQACLAALGVPGADDAAALSAASRGFEGLDSRLQTIGVVDGVTFVDDSLSTNVLPTLAALGVFNQHPVALLAGGFDREIDYRPLAETLRARAWPTLLVALPSNGTRIVAAFEAQEGGGDAESLEVVRIGADGSPETWMSSAVEQAYAWARPRGGVVLLSPAAASFDHFTDYRHRARVFAEAMRRCESS